MKVGDLVKHVSSERGYPLRSKPGLYLVVGFRSTLGMVSILNTKGQTWTACRAHLEVINETR